MSGHTQWPAAQVADEVPRRLFPVTADPCLTSRASDGGSIKDSASDAGSTATMDTACSAGTLASAASTAFFPPTVHFFSLDDFAGHEIHAILENGEHDEHDHHNPADDRHDAASSQARSVRPGSIVSNLETRLGDVEGVQGVEPWAEGDGSMQGAAGSSASHAAGHRGGYSSLREIQYRDLTPSDLQSLSLTELGRARDERTPPPDRRTGSASGAASYSGPSASGRETPNVMHSRAGSQSGASSPCSSVSGRVRGRGGGGSVGGGSVGEGSGGAGGGAPGAGMAYGGQFPTSSSSQPSAPASPATLTSLALGGSVAYADVLRRGVIGGVVIAGVPGPRSVREPMPPSSGYPKPRALVGAARPVQLTTQHVLEQSQQQRGEGTSRGSSRARAQPSRDELQHNWRGAA